MRRIGSPSIRLPRKPWLKRSFLKEKEYFAVRKMLDNMTAECAAKEGFVEKQKEVIRDLKVIIGAKRLRIAQLQHTIDSLKRQNRELQAELIAKDGIIKKQIILMEEAKPKESEYVKAGNLYYCSNCKADFEHYELHNKYCPECGARFTNHRKDAL